MTHFQVIERHFTLDKRQKGTDHKLSLEPNEFQQLITRIRSIEAQLFARPLRDVDNDDNVLTHLLPLLNDMELNDVKMALQPTKRKHIQACEMECRLKLGKSLVYRGHLQIGTTLSETDVRVKVSEPFGISADRFDEFIGKTLIQNVIEDENLAIEHFQT